MDEMAELLSKIKYRCKLLKKEKGLKHGMDITCTLSIFVPKPFTPFQWCPQMNIDKVTEHIHYLKEKTDKIKGVKINYHEKFVSQIEAVLTRGDNSLCQYVEALYKKGCYLDAWGEYFDKRVWQETAAECGISLAELAEKQYSLDEPLTWDFIDIGVDKEWFKGEYNTAMSIKAENDIHIVPTCQTKCVNCGVCTNLKTHKVMAKPYRASERAQNHKVEYHDPRTCPQDLREVFKYRIKLTKTGILKYFSHLDWQNTFFKAISRTDLNVAFSHGFNPTMKISMGVALPLFAQSDGELVDIDLYDDIEPEILKQKLEKVLPEQSKILSVKRIEKSTNSINLTVCWAEYKVNIFNKRLYAFKDFKYNTDRVLSSEEIFIEKKNKKGLLKKTDVKQSIKSYRFEDETLFIILKTGQGTDIPALRADVLMNLIAPDVVFDITRTRFFDENLEEI